MEDKSKIPAGYQRIIPYLVLKSATEFFGFAEKVFGAEEKYRVLNDENLLMHGQINIGGNYVMFCEVSATFPVQNAGMFIYVDDCDGTYKLALENGAAAVMEPSDQDYGRSAGVTDPFGNTWWITTGK